MALILWIVKLWWLEVLIGGLVIVKSVFTFSIFGIIFGSIILISGLIFRLVMSSESMKRRINRNV